MAQKAHRTHIPRKHKYVLVHMAHKAHRTRKAHIAQKGHSTHMAQKAHRTYRVVFFDWSALKMTKYEEKLKYLNWSANCSSRKVLSVNPQ